MLGGRQQHLLELLLHNRAGMTVDELAAPLEISRTAVNQHISALERSGYVSRAHLQKTGGRPGRIYVLTQAGFDLFPKQYSWFSQLLLETLKNEFGSEGLTRYLHTMASRLSLSLRARLAGLDEAQQVAEMANIMSELHYQAAALPTAGPQEAPILEAKNCVYHDLARNHPEICQFDLALLSATLQREVDHQACMVRGDHVCRFRFHKKDETG